MESKLFSLDDFLLLLSHTLFLDFHLDKLGENYYRFYTDGLI